MSNINIISKPMLRIVTSISKSGGPFMASPKQVNYHTNTYETNSGHMDIMKWLITRGLWKHISCPIHFSLVVDDFGVKYVGEDNARDLIDILKEDFNILEDWKEGLYCGINLKWDYDNRTVDISMPGCIQKQLQGCKHQHPSKPQYVPYPTAPHKYGATSQETTPHDTAPPDTK